MTDILDEVNSNSKAVKLQMKDVITFNGTLGKDAYTILEANKRLISGGIIRIPHYSRNNNGKYPHWVAERVNELLKKFVI